MQTESVFRMLEVVMMMVMMMKKVTTMVMVTLRKPVVKVSKAFHYTLLTICSQSVANLPLSFMMLRALIKIAIHHL